ncbi:Hint domain-containing protein [Celeribacter marinus]|uniref:Hint domain-containing protein n=1 Tax=Celeribacter marinus TaxID=1397108 RepID=UPI00316C13E7
MATIYDLIELSGISPDTTYSVAAGNLLGVVDNVTSSDLNDGEFDAGDIIFIGGIAYSIDRIQEPSSSGRFGEGDGSQSSFDPGSESNLSAVFLTVSNGSDVRYFIIPNDAHGDLNVEEIRTGSLTDVAGSDAAVISTFNNQIEIVCFARGTLIEGRDREQVRVEDLREGDHVMTLDHGLRQVKWIGETSVDKDTVLANPNVRPIRIKSGALGGGTPQHDLYVSPQHRVLVASKFALRMFGQFEVLVAAKHLLALEGVSVVTDQDELQYFHILMDAHEILIANGAACESLFLGPQARKSIEYETLVARLSRANIDPHDTHFPPVRPLVTGSFGRKLAARHCKNNQRLCQGDPHSGRTSSNTSLTSA